MRKLQLLFVLLGIIALTSCDKSYDPAVETFECHPENNPINLEFKYGVTAKNILSTYDCTFQKDLIFDPPVATQLKLTIAELDSISAIMDAIGFFEYPDTFAIAVPGDTICEFAPSSKYVLSVEGDSFRKSVYWNDNIFYPDSSADRLRSLIDYMIGLIRAKEEYQALPEATGGYD